MRLFSGLIGARLAAWAPFVLAVFLLTCDVCLSLDGAPRGFLAESDNEPLATDTMNWHVFLVSVKDYNENIRGLNYTDEDVQALYNQFMNLSVPPENITILSKSRPSNTYYPARDQIMTQFAKFIDKLDSNSIAFVYFSGHGFNKKSTGKSYFAPIDFRYVGSKSVVSEAIDLNDEILARLSASKARFSWLCVDACCSYIDTARGELEIGESFSMKSIPEGVLFQQSCEDGKSAYEGVDPKVAESKKQQFQNLGIDVSSPELRHGLFTKALLEALNGQESKADGNEDGKVALSEIVEYVENKVQEDAQLFHSKRQRPCYAVNESKLDDFILLTGVKNGRQLAEEARELIAQGEFDAALDKIREARKLLPNEKEFALIEVNALYGLASVSRTKKDFTFALVTIDEALEIDASNSKCLRLKKVIEREIDNPPNTPDQPERPHIQACQTPALQAGDLKVVYIAGIETRFHWCPPGEFIMGSPLNERGRYKDEPQHRVEVPEGFWLAEIPVTVAAFRAFVNETGYQTVGERGRDRFTWRNPGNSTYGVSFSQEETHPVCCLTWQDARAYVDWLNANYAENGERFQLPSEEHWEYACRAGGDNSFQQSGINAADTNWWNVAHADDSRRLPGEWSDGYRFTSPVDAFEPNSWGLRDMLGNVNEWCSNYYSKDPANPGSVDVRYRVMRGGSWINAPEECRPAFRWGTEPMMRKSHYGFRVELVDASSR